MSQREQLLDAALRRAMASLRIYGEHPIIESQANKALNYEEDECDATESDIY